MSQMTFSDYEYSKRKKKTKREEFLDVMEDIIPWDEWVEFVRPYYPKGKRGRPTKGIEKMLRMYLLQVWFNLSDEGIEDATTTTMRSENLWELISTKNRYLMPQHCSNSDTFWRRIILENRCSRLSTMS